MATARTGPAARSVPPMRAVALAAGDGAVLILWAVLGLVHHAEGVTVSGLLRNAGLVLLGWFAAAALLRTYTHPGLRRFLATWALGVSAGVLARALILGRPWNGDEFAFYGVTLGVTLVLLALWRGLAAGIARARDSRSVTS